MIIAFNRILMKFNRILFSIRDKNKTTWRIAIIWINQKWTRVWISIKNLIWVLFQMLSRISCIKRTDRNMIKMTKWRTVFKCLIRIPIMKLMSRCILTLKLTQFWIILRGINNCLRKMNMVNITPNRTVKLIFKVLKKNFLN